MGWPFWFVLPFLRLGWKSCRIEGALINRYCLRPRAAGARGQRGASEHATCFDSARNMNSSCGPLRPHVTAWLQLALLVLRNPRFLIDQNSCNFGLGSLARTPVHVSNSTFLETLCFVLLRFVHSTYTSATFPSLVHYGPRAERITPRFCSVCLR